MAWRVYFRHRKWTDGICILGFLFFAMLPLANTSIDYLMRTHIKNELQGRAWGVLTNNVGKVIGTGYGRGAGFVIMISGILLSTVAIALYGMKSVRKLEKRGGLCTTQ